MLASGTLVAVCAAALFSGSSSALAVKRTPTVSGSLSVSFSSWAGDATPTNIADVTGDGGGGGKLNGYNVIVCSDTSNDGALVASNAAYYIPDTSNPLAWKGFETGGKSKTAVPWMEGEDGDSWDVWPNNALTTQYNNASDSVGYAIYAVATRVPGTWQYSTLAKLTADDTGLTITRPVQKYITSRLAWDWSTASKGDGFLHVFAKGTSDGATVLYKAKVPWDDIEDPSLKSWSYFSGGESYSSSEADAIPIATGYYNGDGDVFWSDYLQTWVIVAMGAGYSCDRIYVQYSTSGASYGPYTEPQTVVDTAEDPVVKPNQNPCNYAYHSYPNFYPASTTSHELLASWSYAYGTTYKMGKITLVKN